MNGSLAHKHHERERVTLGFWLYLMSDAVLFASLFAAYAVLGGQTFGGPTAGELFSLPYVLVETFLLLTSSFTMGLALLANHKQLKKLTLAALITTLLLGASFVALEVHEFVGLIAAGHGPSSNAFLSSFFALVGTHGLHVTLGIIWMLVLMAHLAIYGINEDTTRKLTILGLFWHFLDLIWIFIFTFVYLFGLL